MLYLLWIGYRSFTKIKNDSDYLLAGERLGYRLYVPALAAVMIGGGVTFGTIELSYQYGISGIWLGLMFSLGFLAFGLILSKKLSKLNVFSVSEMLGKKYGKSSRFISGGVMIVYDLLIAVNAIIGTGVILATLFNINLTTAIIIGGLVVVAYTVLGGMWAVTLTDVVQFLILGIGIVILFMPYSVLHIGGITEVINSVPNSYLNFGSIGIAKIISLAFLYIFGVMVGQDVWQRAFTAKSEKVMRNGSYLAGLSMLLYAFACAVIGIIASIMIPSLTDPQMALTELIVSIVPTGLIGITFAAVLAALMSSASGTLLASSTVMVNDFILPLSNTILKKDYQKKQILLTRVTTILISIIAFIIALYLKNILAALDLAYAVLSGGIFLPVMAALFWKKVSAKIALLSMIVSSSFVIGGIIIEGLSSYNPIIYGLVSGGILMIVGILVAPNTTIEPGDIYDEEMKA